VHPGKLLDGHGVCGLRRLQAEEHLLNRGHDVAEGRVLDLRPLYAEELASLARVQCLQIAPPAAALDGHGGGA